MKIPGRIPETPRVAPATPATAQSPDAGTKARVGGNSGSEPPAIRRDQVEISTDARERVATERESGGQPLSAERIAELRQRVVSGAYGTDEAIEALAQRVLDHPEF